MLRSFIDVTADILAAIPYAMIGQTAEERTVTIKRFSRGELVATFSQGNNGQGSGKTTPQCTKGLCR